MITNYNRHEIRCIVERNGGYEFMIIDEGVAGTFKVDRSSFVYGRKPQLYRNYQLTCNGFRFENGLPKVTFSIKYGDLLFSEDVKFVVITDGID